MWGGFSGSQQNRRAAGLDAQMWGDGVSGGEGLTFLLKREQQHRLPAMVVVWILSLDPV
jgi:hypothetical protein